MLPKHALVACALFLEMVVERSHLEDAPSGAGLAPGVFEIYCLKDYRQVFNKEDSAEDWDEQLLADQD